MTLTKNARLRAARACFAACYAMLASLGGVACNRTSALQVRPPEPASALPHFSFFVASLEAMQRLSGDPQGFGGDLRFGETGDGAGLRGADKICSTIAEQSMVGSGAKTWRAFLSATRGGPDGAAVNAIDRIGEGPWYDRLGRVVSMTKPELIQARPAAHAEIVNDLPNEFGTPNHNPDGTGEVDNHDVLTGSNDKGELFMNDPHVTCNDWTNAVPDAADSPRVGHSWPRTFGGGPPFSPGDADAGVDGEFGGRGFAGMGGGRRGPRGGFPDGGFPDGGFPDGFPAPPPGGFPGGFPGGPGVGDADGGFPDFGGGFPDFGGGFDSGNNWMSSLNEAGCGAGAFVIEMGPPRDDNPTVGSGGGYGGIYCFALTP